MLRCSSVARRTNSALISVVSRMVTTSGFFMAITLFRTIDYSTITAMISRLKAYQFRIYPDAAQRQQLAVEFGNARFVWNRCLDLRSKAYEADQTRHNYVSLNKLVTEWKHGEFPWLADSVAGCLTQVLIDQDKAF